MYGEYHGGLPSLSGYLRIEVVTILNSGNNRPMYNGTHKAGYGFEP